MRQEVFTLAATGAVAGLSCVYFGYGKSSPRLLLEDSSGPQQEEGDSGRASASAGEVVAANRVPWRGRLGGGVARHVQQDIKDLLAACRVLAPAFRITLGEHGKVRSQQDSVGKDWPVCFEFKVL